MLIRAHHADHQPVGGNPATWISCAARGWTHGGAGRPDFTLTVYGANFVPSSAVNWDRQPRATTYVSTHELQAQVLASDIAVNTVGMVTVTTASPNGPITK
jgi:hypothetical protein